MPIWLQWTLGILLIIFGPPLMQIAEEAFWSMTGGSFTIILVSVTCVVWFGTVWWHGGIENVPHFPNQVIGMPFLLALGSSIVLVYLVVGLLSVVSMMRTEKQPRETRA